MCRNRFVSSLTIVALLAGPAAAAAQSQLARVVTRDPARELACGPKAVFLPPVAAIRVMGGEEPGRNLFAIGQTVVINAGSSQGLKPGDQYFVRRAIHDRFTATLSDGTAPISIRTTGWLRIAEVEADVATGTILQACDSITDGDYLEPFVLPGVPSTGEEGEADFANPGRVLMGNERRQVGSAGTLMVLDRGSDHGLRTGQRVTVFRPNVHGGPVLRVANATVVSVDAETSTMHIDSSRDAVYIGDRVAIHR